MKNNYYFLVCLSLVFLSILFLPFYSKAVTCPNDCSGNGICGFGEICFCNRTWFSIDCATSICPNNCSSNGHCNSDGSCSCVSGWIGSDCSSAPPTPQEEAIQAVQDNIQNASELDKQALQKIKEGDYPSLVPIIDNAAESLTNARDGIMHLELTVNAEIKIDRLL